MIKECRVRSYVPSCAQISIRVFMIKECGDAWGRVEMGSCEVSEVVRLAKLLFAVHFSYSPIYLIHFRSYYLSYKLYRRKREY